MQIDRKYKLEKCVSMDPSRESMFNIAVSKKRAVATDGHVLAIVPVKFDTGDTDGWLTPAALTQGRKVTPRFESTITISLNGAQVLIDGTKMVRPTEEKAPAIESIVARAHQDRCFKVGLNASQLKDISDALGSNELVLEFGKRDSPVLVTPLSGEEGVEGLLMPLRINN